MRYEDYPIARINAEITLQKQLSEFATGERREQVKRKIAYLAFECAERTRHEYGVSIEEAWGDRKNAV